MINGRKSGRSRGRRKICCGAAALASCLPLCLSAAEAEDFKEVHAPLTISGAAHNSVTALFAVQGNKQKTGSALLRGSLPEIGAPLRTVHLIIPAVRIPSISPIPSKKKARLKTTQRRRMAALCTLGPKAVSLAESP